MKAADAPRLMAARAGDVVQSTLEAGYRANVLQLDAVFRRLFQRANNVIFAEYGISWMLPRLVGPARALDLLMSARVLLGAEAAEIGLVNRAVEGDGVLDVTLDYARELAHKSSPSSMARMKAQVYGSYERSLAESLEEANRLMLQSFTEPDFGEGVASFLERRPPNFQPLAGAPIPAGSAVPPTSLVT